MPKTSLLSPFNIESRDWIQRRLNSLHKKNPRCHYCKCVTHRHKPKKGKKFAINTATIEHLYSQMDIRRFLISSVDNTVIACYKCNNKMAKEDVIQHVTWYYKNIDKKGKINIKQYAIPMENTIKPCKFSIIQDKLTKWIQNIFC